MRSVKPSRSAERITAHRAVKCSVKMKSTDPLITARQLADQLHISLRTVQLWTKARKLPVIRLSLRCVRYAPAAVNEALKRHSVRAV